MKMATESIVYDESIPENMIEAPSESLNAPDLLAKGFVDLYQPSLSKIENDLKELTNKQEKIHDDLAAEIHKISDEKLMDIQNMIMKMKSYREKLTSIKRQMVHIHHRTRNLKRRATTLQTFKQAEIDARILKRQREETLIAGSSASDTVSNPSIGATSSHPF